METSAPKVLAPNKAKTIAAVAVVLVCLAVPAVFVNTAIGYIPFIAAAVVLLLSWAYLKLLQGSLSFGEQGPDDGCARGEVMPFSLVVENTSWLPALRIEVLFCVSDIFGSAGRVEKRLLTLPPRSKKVFDLGVRFEHIGNCEVGISHIGLYDPLGIFFKLLKSGALHPVTVGPRVVSLGGFDISEKSLLESTKSIKTFINDGMDYSGIRDYEWGDPMKSIHWKLSSKLTDSYFTRLYETPTAPGLAIIIDFESACTNHEQLMSLYDALVESALSVEAYAAELGFDTELLFVDKGGEFTRVTGPVRGNFAELMERIPRIHAGSGHAALELIRQESESQRCQNNVVVCSANPTDGLVTALIGVQRHLRAPYLLALAAKGEAQTLAASRSKALRRLDASGIPYQELSDASQLAGGDAR